MNWFIAFRDLWLKSHAKRDRKLYQRCLSFEIQRTDVNNTEIPIEDEIQKKTERDEIERIKKDEIQKKTERDEIERIKKDEIQKKTERDEIERIKKDEIRKEIDKEIVNDINKNIIKFMINKNKERKGLYYDSYNYDVYKHVYDLYVKRSSDSSVDFKQYLLDNSKLKEYVDKKEWEILLLQKKITNKVLIKISQPIIIYNRIVDVIKSGVDKECSDNNATSCLVPGTNNSSFLKYYGSFIEFADDSDSEVIVDMFKNNGIICQVSIYFIELKDGRVFSSDCKICCEQSLNPSGVELAKLQKEKNLCNHFNSKLPLEELKIDYICRVNWSLFVKASSITRTKSYSTTDSSSEESPII
jgi:hypothetical protein